DRTVTGVQTCALPIYPPLIIAFTSGLLAHHSHGREHAYAQAISYLAMAIWAYLELFHGVNAFGGCSGWRTRSRPPCTSPACFTISERATLRAVVACGSRAS